MPLTVGLIVAGTSALVKTGIGLSQASSAARDQRGNIRPQYSIPQEWYNNDNLSASMAQHGLTEPAINYYTNQAGRGLSSGLGTILQGGGSVNNVGSLYDAYDTGINKISAEDAQLKNSNIENYIKANSQLANEKDKQWTLNEYQPYLDRSKLNAQKTAAGQANIVGGISDLGNDITAYSKAGNSTGPTGGTATTATRGTALPAASSAGFQGINMDSTMSNPQIFSTAGGNDTLNQLIQTNRNSPYIQGLVQQLNQPSQFN